MNPTKPVCYASINKRGDVIRTSKEPQGYRKTPLYRMPVTDDQRVALLGRENQRLRIALGVIAAGNTDPDDMVELARVALTGDAA